jgi:purine-binding chemotaxis protein CheW
MRTTEAAGSDPDDMLSMCSLRCGDGLFGIDTRQVREVLGETTPQRVPLAAEYIAGVVPYRGDVLTTLSFRALLGLGRGTGAGCVLVLDDEEANLQFGFMVDGVGGIVTMARDALEPNPSALDARSMALFCGAYKLNSGLMVRLDPHKLRPSRLAETKLFETVKYEGTGVKK